MKKNFLLLMIIFCWSSLMAQALQGTIVQHTLESQTLQNQGGEKTTCGISVYLPPYYKQSTQRYPVIYYLHGFTGTDTIYPQMKKILDAGIDQKKIKPFILVIPNQNTNYQGSFYTNSLVNGRWEEFTVKDLVQFIDHNYRTLAHRDSRGIAGHSMGGYGAFKLAMLYPEVFSSVYALSPGLLAFVKEFGPNSTSFKELQSITTREQLEKTYYPRVLVAVARAWTPNLAKPPFYADVPFTYEENQMQVNQQVLEQWEANMPVYMVDDYADNLRKLTAIKLDWGRNDSPRFPVQIGMLSQRLENLGIRHYAEEYIGDHGNMIWTDDGRVLSEVLPFFNDWLKF